MCVTDNDSAIVEPMQPTELRCDHPYFGKTKSSDLVQKRKTEVRILHLRGPDKKFTANYLLTDLLCQHMLLC